MRFKFIFVLCTYLSICAGASAQEPKTIIPLSPSSAEMAKYGEVPVGHFTGVPNIQVPLLTISTKVFEFPITLQYHAGGNKVSAIAPEVGLGWSVSGLPIIVRGVNGLPDEGTGGYFHKYQGQTVKQLYTNQNYNYNNFLVGVVNREFDPEPDVFHYTLNGKSGKFYFNQDLNQFVTVPFDNIRISTASPYQAFEITDENGVKYVFNVRETTKIMGVTESPEVAMAWRVSKVVDEAHGDSVLFVYRNENTISYQITETTKYQYIGGGAPGPDPGGDPGSFRKQIQNHSRVISEIVFSTGKLSFVPETVQRSDLSGGYATKSIQLRDVHNAPVRHFTLSHSYLQGSGSGSSCFPSDPQSNRWLLLTGIQESAQGEQSRAYAFDYNMSNVPPCRNSPAQDYWGYYNGATANINLVPTVSFMLGSQQVQLAGANRDVNVARSQFAILQKVTYPTGGYTEFDYENNLVHTTDVSRTYSTGMAYVAAEGEENLPVSRTYTETFVVDNLPDPMNNNQGGTFVNVDIAALGVPPGYEGAVTRFQGISPHNSSINFVFSYSFQNYYVPNGEYRITATFNQDPPQYDGFHYIVTWTQVNVMPTDQRHAGGLRVKEIRSYPSAGALPVVKRYEYVRGIGSTVSSGDIFGAAYFNYQDLFHYYNYTLAGPSNNYVLSIADYLRVKSYSNLQQVSHSGSYVGYATVIEKTSDQQQTGLRLMRFINIRDEDNPVGIPYPPAYSMELIRGLPWQEISYRYRDGQYWPVHRKDYQYNELYYADRQSFGLKVERNIMHNNPSIENLDHQLFSTIRRANYDVMCGWTGLKQVKERTYDQADTTRFAESVTDYYQDNPLHMKHSRVEITNSDGSKEVSYTAYPQDYANTSGFIGDMKSSHSVAYPIEQVRYKEVGSVRTILSGNITTYKAGGKGLVDQVLALETMGPVPLATFRFSNRPAGVLPPTGSAGMYLADPRYKTKLTYNSYDNKGNPLQLTPADGPPISYLWGYGGRYPVAEVRNATYGEVTATGLNLSVLNSLGSTDAQRTTELNKIRNHTTMKKTQVSTYAYKPLIGMTSQTDPSGRTTYYEYDGFGRLWRARDNNGDLLEEYRYNYRTP